MRIRSSRKVHTFDFRFYFICVKIRFIRRFPQILIKIHSLCKKLHGEQDCKKFCKNAKIGEKNFETNFSQNFLINLRIYISNDFRFVSEVIGMTRRAGSSSSARRVIRCSGNRQRRGLRHFLKIPMRIRSSRKVHTFDFRFYFISVKIRFIRRFPQIFIKIHSLCKKLHGKQDCKKFCKNAKIGEKIFETNFS